MVSVFGGGSLLACLCLLYHTLLKVTVDASSTIASFGVDPIAESLNSTGAGLSVTVQTRVSSKSPSISGNADSWSSCVSSGASVSVGVDRKKTSSEDVRGGRVSAASAGGAAPGSGDAPA